jgi:hypothetical protein
MGFAMSNGEIILYNTEDGVARIRLRAEGGTVWLNQAEMAELFQVTKQNVSLHIQNVFDDGELLEEATVKDSLTVQIEGGRQVERQISLYHLEMILAVGYRVRSPRGIQFRRWASETLHGYLVKGFVLNDERLKEPANGWDYFDELLERIRSIRASEKRFYQKVQDLFATSADYDRQRETARSFFKTIQNKLLWAVTGKTAAELIVARADGTKNNMGLTNWSGRQVRKIDIATSKNYLNEAELTELDRLVTGFLDLAEDRASRRQQTTMSDWLDFTDRFLTFAERDLLKDAGKISHEQMLQIASQRYEIFDTGRKEADRQLAEQKYEQDLDAELKSIEDALELQQTAKKKP